MKSALPSLALALAAAAAASTTAAQSQTFEAASIRPSAESGHFFTAPNARGGPGTPDPSLFRCTSCSLAFLISKAYGLERYQFPGQTNLPAQAWDVNAKIPEGATPDQFQTMLQALLKERFHLEGHFDTKQMQGYELVIGKNGPNLKESGPAPAQAAAAGHDGHGAGGWNFGPSIHRKNQSMADLADQLSTQLLKPVDDKTGLKGHYDIDLTWNDDGAHAATHAGGAPSFGGGGFGGGDHGGGGGHAGPQGAAPDQQSGLPLLGAVQAQLGLKLQPKPATAKIFTVDRVDKTPTEN